MKIVIVGAGQVGSHLAKMLSREANEIVVIDDNAERLDNLTAIADVEAISGNPSSISILKKAGVGKCDLFIGVYPSTAQEVNIVGALIAKQLGARKVIARVNDEDFLSVENKLMFKEMGIEFLFYPEKIAADEIVDQLKHTASTETMDFANGRLQIAVFKLGENSPILDLQLIEFAQQLSKEESSAFRVIAISRNGKTIIPSFDTKFQYNDLVFTISRKEGLEHLIKYLGIDNIEVNNVMVVGGNAIARMMAQKISKRASSIKIIEKNKERCISLSEKLPSNVTIVNGDGRNADFLYEENIKDYDAFIALTGNDEANVLACVVAKKFGVARTIAEVENLEYIRLAEEMGVDTVINKKMITASRIFKFTLSGKARFVRYMSGTEAEVLEYTVAPDSAITKGPLKDIDFPANAIIGGVVRGSESFIAVGSTVIEPYDRVAVFALPETIKEIDRFFR